MSFFIWNSFKLHSEILDGSVYFAIFAPQEARPSGILTWFVPSWETVPVRWVGKLVWELIPCIVVLYSYSWLLNSLNLLRCKHKIIILFSCLWSDIWLYCIHCKITHFIKRILTSLKSGCILQLTALLSQLRKTQSWISLFLKMYRAGPQTPKLFLDKK